MDPLIASFASIHFELKSEEVLREIRAPNIAVTPLPLDVLDNAAAKPLAMNATMAVPAAAFCDVQVAQTLGASAVIEDIEEQSQNLSSSSFSQRRQPRRASKENNLTKLQGIVKPKKRLNAKSATTGPQRPSAILKLYLKQKLTGFRPSNLETIFEEPEESTEELEGMSTNTEPQLGARKMRRYISFNGGGVVTKQVLKTRRAKIKRVFGKRALPPKITINKKTRAQLMPGRDLFNDEESDIDNAVSQDVVQSESEFCAEDDNSSCLSVTLPTIAIPAPLPMLDVDKMEAEAD